MNKILEEEIRALEVPDTAALQKTIKQWTSQITNMANMMEAVVVKDEDACRETTDIAVQFIDCQEEIVNATAEAARPYIKALDQIGLLSKKVIAEAERGEDAAKNALLPYFQGILDTEPASQPKTRTGAATAYTRSNTKVVITDEKALAPWHVKTIPDLEAIKKALGGGEDVMGAKLETSHSVVIRRVK